MATVATPAYYTKQRAANYYNNLLTGNEADFHKLLKRFAIHPVDSISGTRLKRKGLAVTGHRAIAQILQNTNASDIKLAKIRSSQLVGYINLSVAARQTGVVGVTNPGDRVVFASSYNNPGGYVPVYFLPWADEHAVRLTIPPMGQNNPDPHIFFTAAISGCSIVFQGTTQNPTIYHCGGETRYDSLDDAAEFWEAVVDEFIAQDGQGLGQRPAGQVQATIDKRQYVAEPGIKAFSHAFGAPSEKKTTARAKAYADALRRTQKKDKVFIEDVAPWGCVLGRRDNQGDWTFYLQENADIIYHSVERNLMNPFKPKVSQQAAVSRPMTYREVFPNGPQHAVVQRKVPRIV